MDIVDKLKKGFNEICNNDSHRRDKIKEYYSKPQVKIKNKYMGKLYNALKNSYNPKDFEEIFGCSVLNMQMHLEQGFDKNMNWNNYGEWHVDHIIPCDSFDLTKDGDLKQCFHWSNLQPLWASDNIRKSNKVI